MRQRGKHSRQTDALALATLHLNAFPSQNSKDKIGERKMQTYRILKWPCFNSKNWTAKLGKSGIASFFAFNIGAPNQKRCTFYREMETYSRKRANSFSGASRAIYTSYTTKYTMSMLWPLRRRRSKKFPPETQRPPWAKKRPRQTKSASPVRSSTA